LSHLGQTQRFGLGQAGHGSHSVSSSMEHCLQMVTLQPGQMGQTTGSGSGHVMFGQGFGIGLRILGQGGHVTGAMVDVIVATVVVVVLMVVVGIGVDEGTEGFGHL